MADKSASDAATFQEESHKAAPFSIHTALTEHGKEFTNHFDVNRERKPTGNHPFDLAGNKHDIEHRLIKPQHPQSNGLIKRFNGQIKEALKQSWCADAKSICFVRGVNSLH